MRSSLGLHLTGAVTLLRGHYLAALSVALCCPGLAAAQAASPPSAAEASGSGSLLDVIVVTARKQSESLQSVPVAISVLSNEDIEESRVFDVAKLGELVPGLVVGGSQQRGAPIIRGITTRTPEVGADSVVGQYIDEVYQPRITSQMTALFDLDRIEVLKGPQGTLYGRNTIGGVINYVTRQPGETLDAYGTLGAGNRHSYEARAGLSGPLAANVSAGISMMARQNDGNIDVVDASGHDIGNDGGSDFGVRAAVRWTPNDRLAVNASIFTLHLRSASLDMTNGNPAGSVAPLVAGLGLYTPSPYTDDNEHYRISRTTAGHLDRTTTEGALRLDYGLPADITLTSLTSYQDYRMGLVNDLDYDVQPIELFHTDEQSRTFSQEVRLGGEHEGNHWTIGANYFYDNQNHVETDDFTDSPVALFFPPPFPVSSSRVKTTSAAAFAQGNVALTHQLGMTAGVRYTYDGRDYRRIAANQLPGFENFDSATTPGWDTRPSWGNTSYLVSLNYQITPDILLYASHSTGYRSGGVQGRSSSAAQAANNYGPEHAKQYEIGTKTLLFDGRARLNVAAYDIDYKDAQINQIPLNSPFGFIRNAAGATMRGVEVESTIRIIHELSAHLAYTYNDSHFTHYRFVDDIPGAIAGVGASTPGGCTPQVYGCSTSDYIFDGVPFEFAPKNTFLVAMDLDHELGAGTRLGLHVEYAWKDDYLLTPLPQGINARSTQFLDANFLRQPAYGLFNATASLQFLTHWNVSIWGRNLTDEHYTVQGGDPQPAVNGFPFNTFLFGDRRTFGATVSWRY